MDTKVIEKLKLACNQFYLGKDLDKPRMSDVEFDQLRLEYEEEYGSVKQLVDWETDMQTENQGINELEKYIVEDNDLRKYIKDYIEKFNLQCSYLNYKYDGSSIKAYYENGKLKKIVGTPDVKWGFIRTKAFWNLFPHEIDPSISAIQGEVLVDAEVYGQLARNKANGLTNSKWKDDEVESEAFIRCYVIDFVDYNSWTLDKQKEALSNLPVITYERERVVGFDENNEPIKAIVNDKVFAPAIQFDASSCPIEPIVDTEDVKFQVDGVVLYDNNEITGFKFYYTESAVTTVEDIEWIHQENGSFVPKLVISPIVLNEKCVSRVASGGFPNLQAKKMGKGAKVRVILANVTIPKVVEVLEPSEDYQFPTCECGYQLSDKDIYGAALKCQNDDKPCDYKVNTWYFVIIRSLVNDLTFNPLNISFNDYFRKEFHWFINQMYVDRWDSYSKCTIDTESEDFNTLVNAVLENINQQNTVGMLEILEHNWYYSDLNWYTFEINVRSWLNVMKKVKDSWNTIDQDLLDALLQ